MTLLAAYLGSLVPALGWTLTHFLAGARWWRWCWRSC